MDQTVLVVAVVVGAVVAFLASEAVRELERQCELFDEVAE